MTNHDSGAVAPKRRPLGEQLHRSPRVLHASWMTGAAVLLSAFVTGGWSIAGIVFLGVLFLPIIVAYRRDRLSFPICFATLFLPAWPWAMYKAVAHGRRPAPPGAVPTPAVPPAAAPPAGVR
ncbi:MAG: hypothetical protein QOE45_1819 [Frankiaceae bacterium]|jgi:hypothetical protein|nr:hypothetical protein [Frankiaceae bacterium]